MRWLLCSGEISPRFAARGSERIRSRLEELQRSVNDSVNEKLSAALAHSMEYTSKAVSDIARTIMDKFGAIGKALRIECQADVHALAAKFGTLPAVDLHAHCQGSIASSIGTTPPMRGFKRVSVGKDIKLEEFANSGNDAPEITLPASGPVDDNFELQPCVPSRPSRRAKCELWDMVSCAEFGRIAADIRSRRPHLQLPHLTLSVHSARMLDLYTWIDRVSCSELLGRIRLPVHPRYGLKNEVDIDMFGPQTLTIR